MARLHETLMARTRDWPREIIKELLVSKLKDAGAKVDDKLLDQFAAAILAGDSEAVFEDGSGGVNRTIQLQITSDDLAWAENRINQKVKELPETVGRVANDLAVLGEKELRVIWNASRGNEIGDQARFKYNLKKRWGAALEDLEFFVALCFQLGDELNRTWGKSRARRGRIKRMVLSQLHGRACQVSGEIIVLLKHGFADGAYARWRTLHEIAVVTEAISTFGDDIAERYFMHRAVEDKKRIEAILSNAQARGVRASSKAEFEQTTNDYNMVRERFGKEFCAPFGWANGFVPRQNGGARGDLTFRDIEVFAGKSLMRLHYKLASHNIHAGVGSISYQLGLMSPGEAILAGPSNAGLEEPGRLTAVSMFEITQTLIERKGDWKLDELVRLKIFHRALSQVTRKFNSAARKLEKDEFQLVSSELDNHPK